jgi:transcriptional regulator with XRE-family HTH domain
MTKAVASKLDVEIGNLLNLAMKENGWTNKVLAEKIGVSNQQVQKYRIGKDRITASRLCCISKAMGIPVSSFLPKRYR